MPELISFGEALAATESGGKRHVLLGNGFSIGANSQFAYGTLYEQAKRASLPGRVVELFERYGTTNFEQVLHHLDEGQWLADHYGLAGSGSERPMVADYEALKDALVHAIASTHPATPNDIGEGKFLSSSQFLNSFKNIFTINYDLLLYWASMAQDGFRFRDGFGRAEDTPDNYVVFLQTSTSDEFIYFLHGALHLTQVDGEIRKFVWSTTGIPLMEQVRDALDQRQYPLVVSEGTARDKRTRIESSGYLSWVFRRFTNIQGHLFTYGWALSEEDEHIMREIARNTTLKSLCVGVYGDPNSKPNQQLITAAQGLEARRAKLKTEPRRGGRRGQAELTVRFYDASTANVWETP